VPGEEPRVVRWKDATEEHAKAGELVAQLLLKEGVGLEADVVLLLDVDGSEWTMKPRNLYVAASRARLRLHVFASNGVELPGRG